MITALSRGALCVIGLALAANARNLWQSEHPTFNQDIAPVIYRYCSDCHRPGESGPFPLLTYSQVKAHAHQIAAVTQARFMPPWLPEPGPLAFLDERRLDDDQIDLIRRWVEGGSPEGSGPTPKPPHFEPGWQLGKPDMIVTAAQPFRIPPSGSDVYWNFILPVELDRIRWVRAVEIRPGDKRLVHHANILLDKMRSARESEKTPGAGFSGMEIRVESEAFDPDSHFLFWKPGSGAIKFPKGMPLKIDPGTDFLLNVHLQPSGKPELVQPSVGLYFTDQPAALHPMVLELENDAALKVPAGAKDFQVSDAFTFPVDVDLLAIYPHAHYLGKKLQAVCVLPDGSRKLLLNIEHWDLNWQGVYTYAHPVSLPKGTTIGMDYHYDNSSDNPRNPNNPPEDVVAGNRAKDEMAHLWLQILPHSSQAAGDPGGADPRLVLQEALSRHEVEKDPTVFEAQYNLGVMLMNKGETAEAVAHLATAAKLRPHDPVVNNALGSAELATGQLESAVIHLRAALKARPKYFDGHYNLGLAYASMNQFSRAEPELRTAVELKPEDADAHANLGATLAEMDKLTEAENELLLALKSNSTNQLARENLAQVRRLLGRR